MLVFRHLHSCSAPKFRELQVKSVIETYNFNGLKIILNKESKNEHPYYSMFFRKYGITGANQGTYTAKNGFSTTKAQLESPDETLDKSPNLQQESVLNDEKRILEDSNIVQNRLSITNKNCKVADDRERLLMSYAAFQKLFYQQKLMKKAPAPSTQPVHKCALCSRKFSSRVQLLKHNSLCPKKHTKKLISKLKQPFIKKQVTPKLKKAPSVIFHCTVCTDHFNSQGALDAHVKYDHRPRPTCYKCFKIFDCRRKLLDHEESCAGLHQGEPSTKQTLGAIDFKASKEIYLCSKCENPFPSNDELRQHKVILNKRKPLPISLSNHHEMNDTFAKNENIQIFIKRHPRYFGVKTYSTFTENTCQECGKSFRSAMRIAQHDIFCHKKLFKNCEFCDKKFRTSEKRNQHFKICSKKHTASSDIVAVSVKVKVTGNSFKRYICSHCKKSYKNIVGLNIHLKKMNLYYCSTCEETSEAFQVENIASHRCPVLNTDIMDYTESDTSVYFCDLCRQNITSYPFRRKNNHVCQSRHAFVHKVLPSSYKCADCKLTFKSESKLEQHLQRKRDTTVSHCTFCSCKSYTKSAQLQEHIVLVHRKKKCNMCNQYYSIRSNKTHACFVKSRGKKEELSNDEGNENHQYRTLYQCYKCNKRMGNKKRFVCHLVGHSQLTPFKCQYCDRMYKRIKSLNDHTKAAHKRPSTNLFCHDSLRISHDILECKNCGDLFLGQEDLKAHRVQIHALSLLNEGELNKNQCAVCKKTGLELNVYASRTKTITNICSCCAEYLPVVYQKQTDKNDSTNTSIAKRTNFTCENCLETFKRTASVNSHCSACTNMLKDSVIEFETIKPAAPSLEDCVNGGETDLLGEPLVETDTFLSMQEAHESLLSLLVDEPSNNDLMAQLGMVCQNEIPIVVSKERGSAQLSQLLRQQRKKVNSHVVRGSSLHHSVDKNKNELKSNRRKTNSECALNEDQIQKVYPCSECSINFDCQSSLNYHTEATHVKTSVVVERLEHLTKNAELTVTTKRNTNSCDVCSDTPNNTENPHAGVELMTECSPVPLPTQLRCSEVMQNPYQRPFTGRCKQDILRNMARIAKRDMNSERYETNVYNNIGSEYYSGLSNYFNDVAHQSERLVNCRQDKAYLDALRLRIQHEYKQETDINLNKHFATAYLGVKKTSCNDVEICNESSRHRRRKQQHPRTVQTKHAVRENNNDVTTIKKTKNANRKKLKRFIFPVQDDVIQDDVIQDDVSQDDVIQDVKTEALDVFERNAFTFIEEGVIQT